MDRSEEQALNRRRSKRRAHSQLRLKVLPNSISDNQANSKKEDLGKAERSTVYSFGTHLMKTLQQKIPYLSPPSLYNNSQAYLLAIYTALYHSAIFPLISRREVCGRSQVQESTGFLSGRNSMVMVHWCAAISVASLIGSTKEYARCFRTD